MSNLQLRILSAIVLIPVVIGAIVMGGYIFECFVIGIWLLSLYEWTRLSLKTPAKIKASLFGFFYLTICFYQFAFLRQYFESGLYLVITMLLVIWAADTGAYFVGRKFGKHKMAPTISPNKSWEGMFGGMISSAVVLTVLILIGPLVKDYIYNDFSQPYVPEYPANSGGLAVNMVTATSTSSGLIKLVLAGAAFAYIGQMGDLLESFLKRKAGVKDSGNLIPGHGGILDRVDSLLMVSPFFVVFAFYVL